jgi:hypothetical protein
MPQELSAPSGLLQKSRFFLPNTNGRIAFLQALLSGSDMGFQGKLSSCPIGKVIAFSKI